MPFTRRDFLKFATLGAIYLKCAAAGIGILAGRKSWAMAPRLDYPPLPGGRFLGVDPDGFSRVYFARNGSPERNMEKVLELMGGIGRFIGPTDIVVLKPNAQWWNQGMTNTDAMKGFIDLVLAIPGFSGEVIIAENHQYAYDNSRGWTTNERNGRFNLNELVAYYQDRGFRNVTKYHWHVGGPCSEILEGDAQGNRIVKGPEDGDGYVWLADTFYISPHGRNCLMTYPVFTSGFSGITIDLKNGAWRDGGYLNKKVKLINFSAINHHTSYGGVTASVKNLMGVVDMTCGWPGDRMADTYNVHHIGVSRLVRYCRPKWHWRLEKYRHLLEEFSTRNFHHAGGALGCFMRTVKMPDLNIITAINVGWGSRTDSKKSFAAKAVVASTDPVALDYIAARDILLSGTPEEAVHKKSGIRYRELNDPEREDGPFRRFLQEAHRQGIGNIDKEMIRTVSHKS